MMSENTKREPVQALKAHLAINVKNVGQSLAFYRNFWGVEPSKVRSGYAKFDVQNPPLNFTLNEVAFKEKGALSHMGIQVASTADVLATRERWAEAGLLTREEMQTSCCYALQDKAWVRDPDGNEWEVFVVLEDNLAETSACECGEQVESTPALAEASANSCGVREPVVAGGNAVSCCGSPVGIG